MRGLKAVAVVIYGLLLTYIVLWAPVRRRWPIEGEYRLRLIPLKGTLNDLLHPKGHNMLAHWVLFLGNFLGNILLFVPYAFILMWVCRITSIRRVVWIGCLTSILLETIQYIYHLGVADVDDVLLNTLGTALGAYLYKTFFSRLNTPIACKRN
ncbi:VanZ family protein [Chitinophaga agrisoli]|uniref:VanZ family protein n=1 Tax=Chitinophaga agrisoli TaxID=2607653 RepID=A0A5B2VX33_9BACT|nr:VanZ family protein [Chitinophaga agrisoli]KAA2243655.1 VanZ family protein [Chitinophaga agrisoli]